MVHVGEKGTKQFFRQRKKHILSLNRDQYHSHDDKVKVEVDEYQELIRGQQDAEAPGQPAQREPADKKESVELPPIGAQEGSTAIDLTNKKLGPGAQATAAKAAKSKLFDTGLRSTSLVVDRVKERVYKPPKASSLTGKGRAGAQSYKGLEAESREKIAALEKEATKLRKVRQGEEPEDESEERRRAQHDGISDEVEQLRIGPEGQAVLNEETRNLLA